jgi:alpha-beta hydrolase superfamily lysophospholipase
MKLETVLNDPLEPIVHAFNAYWTDLRKEYSQLGQSLGLSSDSVQINTVNRPTFKIASTSEVAIFIHGFMGSPAEMSGSAQAIEELGFSVLNLLIPGFGADPKLTDHFSPEDWESKLDPILDAAIQCFQRVHLVGFSTGGLLIHSYLRRRMRSPDLSPLDLMRIKSVSFYSPFYSPHYSWADIFGKAIGAFAKFLPVTPIFKITRLRELKVMTLRPEEYLQKIPLLTGHRIEMFGRKVIEGSQISIPIPALLFLSHGDQVLNQQTSEAIVRRDFLSVKVRLFETRKVPHHLMVKAVHEGAPDVWLELKSWITNQP